MCAGISLRVANPAVSDRRANDGQRDLALRYSLRHVCRNTSTGTGRIACRIEAGGCCDGGSKFNQAIYSRTSTALLLHVLREVWFEAWQALFYRRASVAPSICRLSAGGVAQ